jgi:SpoVK/Ycf46/Vps4 family AAA+-type ATPase
MKAELLKRLFRAIASDDREAIQSLLGVVIEEERQKGHAVLADQLENIAKKNSKTGSNLKMSQVNQSFLPEIPQSLADLSNKALQPNTGSAATYRSQELTELRNGKRFKHSLAVIIPRDQLRHYMILPEAVEQRFQRIEREYVARDRLAHFGFRYRQKVLLYGSPGCGKTMGAERLAWNVGLPMVKVRFDALMSSFLGETASNLREVFEVATQTPCLLFIDEVDAIAKSRDDTQEVGEIKRVVNTFLLLLDEYAAPNSLLVAATNLDQSLDHAVRRRFDEVIEVPKPTTTEIRAILKQTLSSVAVGSLDWEALAQQMNGFSAAETVKVAQDAAKRAILEREELVIQQHLEEAIKEIQVLHV